MSKISWSGIASACALALFVGVAGAQLDEQSPCEEVCQAQLDSCISVCSDHRNPVECEVECRTRAESCLQHCDRGLSGGAGSGSESADVLDHEPP